MLVSPTRQIVQVMTNLNQLLPMDLVLQSRPRSSPREKHFRRYALSWVTSVARSLTSQQLLIAAFPPYFLCNMFVKHAWLTFYYGLARTRPQTWFIHFMQFIAAAFGISSVLVTMLQCVPLSHVWTRWLIPPVEDGAQCINLMAFFYFNSIFMIANDTVLYLIPIMLLRNVDMLRGHRWGIYTLFGVGGM